MKESADKLDEFQLGGTQDSEGNLLMMCKCQTLDSVTNISIPAPN
jgi:hypothetical protein